MATAVEKVAAIETQLRSNRRLDRDKAVLALETLLRETVGDAVAYGDLVLGASSVMLRLLADPASWEARHGGLIGAALLVRTGQASDSFIDTVGKRSAALLRDDESRVQTEAGVTLAVLCEVKGVEMYPKYAQSAILSCIRDNLQRDPSYPIPLAFQQQQEQQQEQEQEKQQQQQQMEEKEKENVVDRSSSPTPNGGDQPRPSSPSFRDSAAFHESAGWKTLESGSRALWEILKTTGPQFAPYLDSELLDLLFASLRHTNRFVRETSYYACGELCAVLKFDGEVDSINDKGMSARAFADRMAPQLAIGLSDNWSQVRMAGAVATRRLLLAMPMAMRELYFPILVPRLCLNRYYVAEGVRLFSQESWKQIAGNEGKDLVAKYINETVDFYVAQTLAENHAVREAACACIAELGSKIPPDTLRPHVKILLKVLVDCFKDESWPVRDAACIASGRFIKCCPEEAKEYMPEIYELFFQHLGDNIWSVRENAAAAIGLAIDAFGQEAVDYVCVKLKEMMTTAKSQPAASTANAGLENVTIFGVASPVVANEMEGGPRRTTFKSHEADPQHTDQTMFSCGSLAPKLKRKGGCCDHGYKRPQEPWEVTDGCFYLVRELSLRKPEAVGQFMETYAEMTKLRHFKHHFNMLETAWKQLPTIAEKIGKKNFKQYIEAFIEPLHYTLQCGHNLARSAAIVCVQSIGKLIGPSILRGRIELVNPNYLQPFELALEDRSVGPLSTGAAAATGVVRAQGGQSSFAMPDMTLHRAPGGVFRNAPNLKG